MDRKLAAILAADVVGYSRLMERDETGTLAALKSVRAEVFDPTIADHAGRIVKLMGDGALVEFASVVDAVGCAVRIQRRLAERNAGKSETARLEFRIGIHLGDVIVEGEDIYGSGVNLAARLEGLAEPGGICISQQAFDQVERKLNVAFVHLGDIQVKNIEKPVGTYAIVLGDKPPAAPKAARPGTRRGLLAGSGLLIALIIGAAALWLEPWMPSVEPALSPRTIAVMPFTFHGDEQLAYLGEGIANLLSTSLDGAGDLRSVNAHALLSYADFGRSGPLDHDQVRSIAEHFRAGLYVVGDISESGGVLRIGASLFDQQNGAKPRTSESVEGSSEDLFELVDRLAARLAAGLVVGATARRTRIAAMTTSSLPAIKAYLEGEKWYRSGQYTKAVELFQEAVAADPSFALAFYRLSMAQERHAWPVGSLASARLAYRNSERLSDHDRQFLEAVVALRNGATSEAEQMFRVIVRAYPDDAEAWYQLGEIVFHGAPLRGGSMSEAREPFSQVLVYDPSDLGALYHLARIAVKDGDRQTLDRLTDRFVEVSPTGERTLELRALKAFSVGDSVEADRIRAELRKSPDPFLPLAAWSVATFAHDPSGAVVLTRLMTEDNRARDFRARGHFLLAHLELARGRRQAAKAELKTAFDLGDPGAREAEAWLAALPFLPTPRADIQGAITLLESWDDAADVSSSRRSAFFTAHNGVHHVIRRYLLGVLAARLGETDSASNSAGLLDRESGNPGTTALARQLAQGLRAQIAIAQDRTADALAVLEQLQIEGWYELTFFSPFYSGALERFALAELLLRNGRYREALAWYVGLGENSLAELVFFGPSLLRRARIHELLGQAKEAKELRQEFDLLWQDADPDVRSLVIGSYDEPLR